MLLILDTSVLISVLVSRGKSFGREIIKMAYAHKLQLVGSKETLLELQTTIKSDHIKKLIFYESNKMAPFIAWYKYNLSYFSLEHADKISLSRDYSDNMYLQLAQVSKANYLISLDNDLLELKKFEKTIILNPEEFIKRGKIK